MRRKVSPQAMGRTPPEVLPLANRLEKDMYLLYLVVGGGNPPLHKHA